MLDSILTVITPSSLMNSTTPVLFFLKNISYMHFPLKRPNAYFRMAMQLNVTPDHQACTADDTTDVHFSRLVWLISLKLE
jgi:hypothetical protein